MERSKRILWVWIGFAVTMLILIILLRRAALYFLPLFLIFPFWVTWGNRGGDFGGDEDPADWWKKGKPPS